MNKDNKTLALVQGHWSNDTCIKLECKVKYLWWQLKRLSFTASGYGDRIPTSHMIKLNGRWHRVFCRVWGNSGTCYIEIEHGTRELIVHNIDVI